MAGDPETLGGIEITVGVDLSDAEQKLSELEERLNNLTNGTFKVSVDATPPGPDTQHAAPPKGRRASSAARQPEIETGAISKGLDAGALAKTFRSAIEMAFRDPIDVTLVVDVEDIQRQLQGLAVPIAIQSTSVPGGAAPATQTVAAAAPVVPPVQPIVRPPIPTSFYTAAGQAGGAVSTFYESVNEVLRKMGQPTLPGVALDTTVDQQQATVQQRAEQFHHLAQRFGSSLKSLEQKTQEFVDTAPQKSRLGLALDREVFLDEVKAARLAQVYRQSNASASFTGPMAPPAAPPPPPAAPPPPSGAAPAAQLRFEPIASDELPGATETMAQEAQQATKAAETHARSSLVRRRKRVGGTAENPEYEYAGVERMTEAEATQWLLSRFPQKPVTANFRNDSTDISSLTTREQTQLASRNARLVGNLRYRDISINSVQEAAQMGLLRGWAWQLDRNRKPYRLVRMLPDEEGEFPHEKIDPYTGRPYGYNEMYLPGHGTTRFLPIRDTERARMFLEKLGVPEEVAKAAVTEAPPNTGKPSGALLPQIKEGRNLPLGGTQGRHGGPGTRLINLSGSASSAAYDQRELDRAEKRLAKHRTRLASVQADIQEQYDREESGGRVNERRLGRLLRMESELKRRIDQDSSLREELTGMLAPDYLTAEAERVANEENRQRIHEGTLEERAKQKIANAHARDFAAEHPALGSYDERGKFGGGLMDEMLGIRDRFLSGEIELPHDVEPRPGMDSTSSRVYHMFKEILERPGGVYDVFGLRDMRSQGGRNQRTISSLRNMRGRGREIAHMFVSAFDAVRDLNKESSGFAEAASDRMRPDKSVTNVRESEISRPVKTALDDEIDRTQRELAVMQNVFSGRTNSGFTTHEGEMFQNRRVREPGFVGPMPNEGHTGRGQGRFHIPITPTYERRRDERGRFLPGYFLFEPPNEKLEPQMRSSEGGSIDPKEFERLTGIPLESTLHDDLDGGGRVELLSPKLSFPKHITAEQYRTYQQRLAGHLQRLQELKALKEEVTQYGNSFGKISKEELIDKAMAEGKSPEFMAELREQSRNRLPGFFGRSWVRGRGRDLVSGDDIARRRAQEGVIPPGFTAAEEERARARGAGETSTPESRAFEKKERELGLGREAAQGILHNIGIGGTEGGGAAGGGGTGGGGGEGLSSPMGSAVPVFVVNWPAGGIGGGGGGGKGKKVGPRNFLSMASIMMGLGDDGGPIETMALNLKNQGYTRQDAYDFLMDDKMRLRGSNKGTVNRTLDKVFGPHGRSAAGGEKTKRDRKINELGGIGDGGYGPPTPPMFGGSFIEPIDYITPPDFRSATSSRYSAMGAEARRMEREQAAAVRAQQAADRASIRNNQKIESEERKRVQIADRVIKNAWEADFAEVSAHANAVAREQRDRQKAHDQWDRDFARATKAADKAAAAAGSSRGGGMIHIPSAARVNAILASRGLDALPVPQFSEDTFAEQGYQRAIAGARAAQRTARGKLTSRALSTTFIQLAQNTIAGLDREGGPLERMANFDREVSELGRLGRMRGSTEGRRRQTIEERLALRENIRALRAAGAPDDEINILRARFKGLGEESQRLTRDYRKQSELLNKQQEAVDKASQGIVGFSDVMRNLGAGFVGGIAGGLVTGLMSQITGVISAGIQNVAIPILDQRSGHGLTANRRNMAMAQALMQGNLGPDVIAAQLFAAGFGPESAGLVEGAIDMGGRGIAGSRMLQDRIEIQRTAERNNALARQLGIQGTGINPNTVLNTNAAFQIQPSFLMPNGLSIGGDPSFAEQLQGRMGDAMKQTEVIKRMVNTNPFKLPWEPGQYEIRSTESMLDADAFKSLSADLTKAIEDAGFKGMFAVQGGLASDQVPQDFVDNMNAIRAGMGDTAKSMGLNITGGASLGQLLQILNAYGNPRLSPDQYVAAQGQRLTNQFQMLERQTLLANRGVQASSAIGGLMNPLLAAGTGIPGGMSVGAARAMEELDAEIATNREQDLAVLGQLAGAEGAEAIERITDLGARIRDLNQESADMQAAQQWKEYNHQVAIAKRQVADLAGLVGKKNGSEIGQMERLNMLDQRRLQALQFRMQQRDLNFEVAIAGFSFDGATGEEAADRRRIARIRAREKQQQLDLSKGIFDRGVKIVDEQNLRAFNDAAFALEATVDRMNISKRVAENAQQVERLGRLASRQEAFLNNWVQRGTRIEESLVAFAAEVAEQTGKTIDEVFRIAEKAYREAQRAVMEPLPQSRNDVNRNPSGAPRSQGGTRGFEAEGGQWISLDNKGKAINLSFDLRGSTIRSDDDIDRIAKKVEDILNRKARLLGLNRVG